MRDGVFMKSSDIAKGLGLRLTRRLTGRNSLPPDPCCGESWEDVYSYGLQVYDKGRWVDVPVFDIDKRRYDA
jgi:hypothetical protein